MSDEVLNALCRQKLSAFSQKAWHILEPSEYVHNWHVDCICEHLEYVYHGDIKRLIINIPPRMLKTYLANICFSAWGMGQDAGKRFLGVSYAHRLSEKIAYKTRTLMESEWYRQLFPETILDKDQQQKTNFMTAKGGGRFSTSVGASITGEGGNILIFDDPINPDEALSDVQRMNSNEWVDQSTFTRLNNPKEDSIVCIMQRLHSVDTTGHLMEKGDWELLKLPAETNKKIFVGLGEKSWEYDELLMPERLSRDVLDDLKANMGSYAYSGQFLQEPVPLGGGEFNRDNINYFQSASFDTKRCNLYILVDPATSKKKTSDYTAMVVWALAPDNNFYLIDGLRERLNPTERVNALFELHRKWNTKTGKPPKVGYERYGMMSDIHYIEEKQKQDNYRFPVKEIYSKLQKEERIRKLIPPMESGQIWLANDIFYQDHRGLSKNLINDIIEQEMMLFPFSAHDDFIDAMSMVFDMDLVFPKSGHVNIESDYLDTMDNSMSVFDL